MARRSTYTRIERENFTRPVHVNGMGDVLWRGFQCLNPDCTNQIVVREEEATGDFSIKCDRCGFLHQSGEAQKIYDYKLVDERYDSIVQAGVFELLHDDYIKEAAQLKYCVLCGALKPVERFDRHSSRRSRRQGECNLCKQVYNGIKNQTRLPEQHREASQKRRLYTQFDSSSKIDMEAIYGRFDRKCFKCGVDLSTDLDDASAAKLGNLDHTLPVFWLWPLTVNNATLLCRLHNGEKAEKWPGVYYNDSELRGLSTLTGIEYRTLKGEPFFNPEAIKHLRKAAFVETLFKKFAAYPNELLRLRNRVLAVEGFDFLTSSPTISATWREKADAIATT